MQTSDFEQLGVFYLGRPFDLGSNQPKPGLTLYESKDLVTHALCVGMTGSGKTGLCLALLEEAALDGIPAIVIDPKGDLANLLLTFPRLEPADFLPWINQDEARIQNQTPEQFAAGTAQRWKEGLAEWGQDGTRIARLRACAEFTVYTPGSSAGVQVSLLGSFEAPPQVVREAPELLRERVSTTVSSLLGLLSIEADPLQ
ncbi:MAG: helicase HerA domain-containing protein, partial [Planctomycetia bacterium]